MIRQIALTLSLLFFLAAFPLVSAGTTGGNVLLWQLGLGFLLIGGLIPPVGRAIFVRRQPEPPPTKAGVSEDTRC